MPKYDIDARCGHNGCDFRVDNATLDTDLDVLDRTTSQAFSRHNDDTHNVGGRWENISGHHLIYLYRPGEKNKKKKVGQGRFTVGNLGVGVVRNAYFFKGEENHLDLLRK